MRQRAGQGLIGRIQFLFRTKPVLAIGVSVLSLLVIGSAITFATPLRCGPAHAFGLTNIASGCTRVGSAGIKPKPTSTGGAFFGNPASPPNGNPASGAFPPDNNPASGAFPPQTNQASPGGTYPAFYPPVSAGFPSAPRPRLDCRLPVTAGGPGSGGFIVFPGGTYIADPSSSVTLPATSPTAPPVGGPGPGYGQGYGGLSYDRQFSRWVPVPANQVSPDGRHYAWAPVDGIYVMNVATGTQTELGEGHSWSLAAVEMDGVYAGDPNTGGLWLLPYSGAPREIARSGYWRAATSTAAYGTATSAVPPGVSNTIIRLDLRTGETIDWFSKEGTTSGILGFDGRGYPVLNVNYLNGSGNETWIATGPKNASAIAGYSQPSYGPGSGFNSYSTTIADNNGVWFQGNYQSYNNSASGVALYVAGKGFYWMSSIGGQLAGGCY